MESKNSFWKKILIFLGITLILLIAAAIAGSITQLFFKDPIHSKITWGNILKSIKDGSAKTLIIIFFVIFFCTVLYFTIKQGFFQTSKLLNREDRAASGLHGQARFQTPTEMARNFGQKKARNNYTPYAWDELDKSDFEGYICNSFKKGGKLYVEAVAKRQACVIGGTGSGKTTGFISPTIQANAKSKKKSSMFIYDLKGELYKMHSKLLSDSGYRTIIINFKEPVKSVKYNPLSLIWDLYQEYKQAKDIVLTSTEKDDTYTVALEKMTDLETKISNYITDVAMKIVPTATGENKIWSEGSQGIIKGLLWGMLEDSNYSKYPITKEKFTLSQLGNILNIPSQSEELFNFLQDRDKDSIVFKKAGSILNNESEKTVSSYISNTQTNLEKFTEKTIELVTSASDFELDEIINQPTAIFLVIDDTNDACNVLASMICSQIRNYLVLKADTLGGSLERTWYFLLDEFANMPKLDNYGKFTSTDRGRNIFYCAIVQSISQFKKNYSEDEKVEILNNADFQMFLGSNEVESLKYIQNLFGSYTQYNRNANLNTQNFNNNEYSGSLSLTERKLVNIDDLQYMPRGDAFLYIAKLPPCKTKLVPFYDKELQDNKSFKIGAITIKNLNETPSFEKTFYDLEQRRRIFLGQEIAESQEITPTVVNSKKIIDTTEDDIVDDLTVNQLSLNDISKLLGWGLPEESSITENNSNSNDEKKYEAQDIPSINVEEQHEDDLIIEAQTSQTEPPIKTASEISTEALMARLRPKRNKRRKVEDDDED